MLVGSRVALLTPSCYSGSDDDDAAGEDDYTTVTSSAARAVSNNYETFEACDVTRAAGGAAADAGDDSTDELNGYAAGLTKSVSMPSHVSTSNAIPLDPFPELSRFKLAPISSRLYSSLDEDSSPTPSATSLGGSPSLDCPARRSTTSGGNSPLSGTPPQNTADTRLFPERMMLSFYQDDQSTQHHPVMVDTWTTVAEVCDELVVLNHTVHSPHWTVFERISKYQLERGLEHHEMIYSIYKTWSADDDGRFIFRKDFSKYELFRNPAQFFPEHMVETKLSIREDTSGLLTRSERYKNLLLQNLLANQCIPDIQGYIHMREGKKSWKKYFFVLRGSGLYYSTKGCQKEPQFLILVSSLVDVNIFTAVNAKKVFGAPSNFGFCLRPSQGLSDARSWKVFSVDDEQSRLCWLTGMRFVKYGSQLRENLRLTLKCDDTVKSSDTNDNTKQSNSPLYMKSRVAMDFSGDRGRVVADPNEALGVAFEEGYNWRKKAALRNTCTQQMRTEGLLPEPLPAVPAPPALCARPCPVTAVHLTQPWFHGHISRETAVNLIADQGMVDGMFLVRNSQSIANVYVLSFVHNHKVKHCTIRPMEQGGLVYYSLDGSIKFMDLIQLVDFYQLNAGALPTQLTYPVSRLL